MTKEELVSYLEYEMSIGADIFLSEDNAKVVINALKQPEQKVGKWVVSEKDDMFVTCSNCHSYHWRKDIVKELGFKCCPHCEARMEGMIHELKILPEYYEEVKAGNKNFELRKNDRDYMVHDTLRLRAWDGEKFLDKPPLERVISYMLMDCKEYGLMDGYVILGFR